MKTAYAVMFLDRDARRVRGVGVFSEDHPSTRHFTVPLFEVVADYYEAAHKAVLHELETNPGYAWLKDVVEWERGKLGRSPEKNTVQCRYLSSTEIQLNDHEERLARIEGHLVLD